MMTEIRPMPSEMKNAIDFRRPATTMFQLMTEAWGRATVLEFWATWCPPCREAIPHLNELADQFKDSPIDFLSLTPESEETVIAFSQNSSNAWSCRT
jgi:thiol-disulfide isomerase/thioredoxin